MSNIMFATDISTLMASVSNGNIELRHATDVAAVTVVDEVESIKKLVGALLSEAKSIHALMKGEEGELYPEILQAQLDEVGNRLKLLGLARNERENSKWFLRGVGARSRIDAEAKVAEEAAMVEWKHQQAENAKQQQEQIEMRRQAPKLLIKMIKDWRTTNQSVFMELSKLVNTSDIDTTLAPKDKMKERNDRIAAAVPVFLYRTLKNVAPKDMTEQEWQSVAASVSDFMVRGVVAQRTSYYNLTIGHKADPQWDEEWRVIRAYENDDPKFLPVAHESRANFTGKKLGKRDRKAANNRAQHEDEKPEVLSIKDAELLALFTQ